MKRQPWDYVDEPLRWLRGNGHDLAPVNGQDGKALLAIAACYRLWARGDADARRSAIKAVAQLASCMQAHTRPLAKALIPWALDWSHEEQLWPQVQAALSGIAARRAKFRRAILPLIAVWLSLSCLVSCGDRPLDLAAQVDAGDVVEGAAAGDAGAAPAVTTPIVRCAGDPAPVTACRAPDGSYLFGIGAWAGWTCATCGPGGAEQASCFVGPPARVCVRSCGECRVQP